VASGTAVPAEAEGPQQTAPWPVPRSTEPPLPLLAPYFGVVAALLCVLIGAWLLLAPYAFDYRHAAAKVPQSTTVDLATGGAVFALSALTAALFAGCIGRRLQAGRQQAESIEAVSISMGTASIDPASIDTASGEAVPDEAASAEAKLLEGPLAQEAEQEPESEPILAPPLEESFSFEPHKPPLADPAPPQPEAVPQPTPGEPGAALRDLLAPLVAALTADLNSRERERDHGYGYGASRGSTPSGGRRPDA
jgi:hypothetical protein